jgi:hypothetical protein
MSCDRVSGSLAICLVSATFFLFPSSGPHFPRRSGYQGVGILVGAKLQLSKSVPLEFNRRFKERMDSEVKERRSGYRTGRSRNLGTMLAETCQAMKENPVASIKSEEEGITCFELS